MKTIQFTLLAIVATLFIQGTPVKESESTGIQFFDGTWEEALQASNDQHKLIFMDAYTSWCGPCKMMSHNTFTNEEVGAYFNENFINVKMDMEKGIGPKLAEKYGVRAYPTLLFIDNEGNVTFETMGYHNAEQLMAVAKKAQATGA